MKKAVSLLAALSLLITMMPASLAEENAKYIPAPYAIDAELQGPTEYLAPVFYENEGGPTIGVTLVGVIVEDGKYFRDSNNNQKLDAFEDWRLDTETRAADLVSKMTVEQRTGLLQNQLNTTPTAKVASEVYDENGKVIFSQLMAVTPDALHMTSETAAANSTGMILTYESRSGVLRSWPDVETGALWNNAMNMTTEYAAVAKSEPAIPFIVAQNPDNMWKPNELAAAVMGDVAGGGNYDLVLRAAELDRQKWVAMGMDFMYGPQIDLIVDPRWPRNSQTYTEVPEVNAGIAENLIRGYKDGQGLDSISVTLKHFPGDGASYNGFESHNAYGQWRIYATEGSLEKYQLPGFQAAIDAGATGVMPGYSRPTTDGRSKPQSYRGVAVETQEIANAYNKPILQNLLRENMGFKGYINTDSGVLSSKAFGAEELTPAERVAAMINAGSDVIGETFGVIDIAPFVEAVSEGMITEGPLTAPPPTACPS